MSILHLPNGATYRPGPAPVAKGDGNAAGSREPVAKAELIEKAAYFRRQVELTENNRELCKFYEGELAKAEADLESAR